jgi:tetratricopeptide (TPR) repeat protein
MERVPSTPAQKLEVATAWSNSGYIELARPLLEDAARQSTNPLEKSIILRREANLYFQFGEFDAGRAAYRDALELQLEELPELLQPNYAGETEFWWAEDELNISGDCEEARKHATRAAEILRRNAERVDTYALPEKIADLEAKIATRCA